MPKMRVQQQNKNINGSEKKYGNHVNRKIHTYGSLKQTIK